MPATHTANFSQFAMAIHEILMVNFFLEYYFCTLHRSYVVLKMHDQIALNFDIVCGKIKGKYALQGIKIKRLLPIACFSAG